MANEKVWIENTQARIIHLPSDTKQVGEQIVLTGNQRSLMPSYKNADGKFLTADGKSSTLNAVDKGFWDRKKNKAPVKAWMRLGWIRIHDQATEETNLSTSLALFGIPTARTLIEVEDNPKVLLEWRAQEARPEIIGSIDARLGELNVTPVAAPSLPPLKGKKS